MSIGHRRSYDSAARRYRLYGGLRPDHPLLGADDHHLTRQHVHVCGCSKRARNHSARCKHPRNGPDIINRNLRSANPCAELGTDDINTTA